MFDETYELIAMGMRYWFVLLGVIIVIQAARWLWHDNRRYQTILHSLPDAGFIGEIVDLDSGQGYPLAREATVGSARSSDVRLNGLRARHAELVYVPGRGVQIKALRRNTPVTLDGQPVQENSYGVHGSRIDFDQRHLRLRLFAGLEATEPVRTRSLESEAMAAPAYCDAAQPQDTAPADAADMAPPYPPEGEPGMVPVLPDVQTPSSDIQAGQYTWPYAVPPEGFFAATTGAADVPSTAEDQPTAPKPGIRRLRALRRKRK